MIYAEKHFSIERYGKKIHNWIIWAGNAGAIVVAVMLYKETGNLKYYEIAADMEKICGRKDRNRKWIRMEIKRNRRTAGWKSHGNSGFLMAYAALYECNHKADYADKIQLCWDMRILCTQRKPNWKDLRESSGKASWMHGAMGKRRELAFTNETEELFPEDMQIKKTG